MGRRPMGFRVLAVALVLGFGATGHLPAPTVPPIEIHQPVPVELIFPGIYNTFPVTPLVGMPQCIVPGEFTGDVLGDVVLHDGSSARLVASVDVFAVGRTPIVSATGVVRHRPAGATRDVLIGSDASGLSSWRFEDDGTVTATSLGHAAWAGATSLVIGTFGGGASSDLAGISPTGEVLVLLDFEEVSSATTTFTTLGDPLQLILADWTGDGSPELVLRSTTGVRIHAPSGVLISKARSYGTTGAICKLRGSNRDRIAWATPHPSGNEELLVILEDGAVSSAISLGVGTTWTGSIAAGDLDGDSLDDLCLRRGADGHTLILLADATGYDPSDDERAQWLFNDPGDSAASQPCFVDLEKDGDLDLLWARQGGSRICAVRSRTVDSTEMAPAVQNVDFDIDTSQLSPPYLEITFDNGEQVPSGSTHIEAAVFRKSSLTASTESTPVAALLIPYVAVPQGGDPPPYGEWFISLPESGMEFPSIYSIVVRYVTLDGSDEIAEAGPTRVLQFSSELEDDIGSGGTLDSIIFHGGWWNIFSVGPDTPPSQDPPAETSTGTVIETKPVPDPEDDDDPVFGDGGD